MQLFNKKSWKITSIIAGALTVFLVAALLVGSYFEQVINVYLDAETQKVVPEPGAKIYYWNEYTSEEELAQAERALCEEIVGEGAALLLNKDDALPLDKDTKFSCFSQSSVDPIYAGTGSASVGDEDSVTLNAALESAFEVGCNNTELVKFYRTSGYKRENAKLSGGSPDQYRINEVPWSKYSEPLKNTFRSYGDVALVMLSRSGGEGSDLPHNLSSLTEYMTDGDYLQLCKEEKDLLSNLYSMKQEGVFKKIVVLLNTANIMQIDFVEEYGVDALLWTGFFGKTGLNAVAELLSGERVPSGRIVDTFLKDNHASPAMVNFGKYPYENADEYELEETQNNTGKGIVKANRNYVVYQEGIYVGYRYYETRYEDYVLGKGNAGEYDYSKDVAYPFGRGLSYVDFTYSNFNVAEKDNAFEIKVDVKNEGERDAKHTVQIYFRSPYGQYEIENGVEKSAIELCGFDKKAIKAGDTETYTVTIKKEDLTSYDSNGAKTYILSEGDYYFTVGTDAHNAVNNILMAKNADVNKMQGEGDAALAYKWNNPTLDTTTYSRSSATNNSITNLFDNADLNKYAETSGQTITYLTRNDWVGTYPKQAVSLSVTEQMWADGLTHTEEGRVAVMEKYKADHHADVTVLPQLGKSGTLAIADVCELAITDGKWDELIVQMTYAELINLVTNGMYMTQAVESISLPGTGASDGPYGYTKPLSGGGNGMCFPCESILASSYNVELAKAQGGFMAEDLWKSSGSNSGSQNAMLYAPGANIHRTPYSGRNGEYYSEDGWISGVMCAAVANGMQEKGVIAIAKHYAVNDQEEGRYGISTWSNEQAIREVYLEGFEGFVTGGGIAIMSSFNRLGVVWAGAHHGLMTGVLREEWGLKGMAITDMASQAKYMDYRAGLLAGQDIWLGYSSGMVDLNAYTQDPAIVTALQTSAKRIAYTVAHSYAINVGNATIISITPWWKATLIALLATCGALTAGAVAMTFISKKKEVKHEA